MRIWQLSSIGLAIALVGLVGCATTQELQQAEQHVQYSEPYETYQINSPLLREALDAEQNPPHSK